MADGPFFTGNLDSLKKSDQKNKNTKATTTSTTSADGIERYSDRYKKVQKIGRTIEEHPYQPQFFPEELYSVMGITNKEKKKILALSKFKSNGGLKEFLSTKEIEDMNEAEKAKAMAQELLNIADDHDDHKGENNSGDEEEEMDDAYEDDEEDDYNAEQYFDDGDDDGGDDGGDDEAAF
ncbi:RPC31 DNA-directed RNA polymerase III subunit RPC7 [Candida maltosa Xu316]